MCLGLICLLAVLCPLHYYHQKHPVNLLLLGLFTVAISFAVGMTCAFTSGNLFSCYLLCNIIRCDSVNEFIQLV